MADATDELQLDGYSDNQVAQIVVFGVEDEEYGIQISQVLEISDMIPIVRMPKAPYFVEGVVNLRNLIIPIVDLHKRFKLSDRVNTPLTSIIIIEENDGNKVGFIVDSVKEVINLPFDQIDEKPTLLNENIGSDFMAGVGKIGARLVILLDVESILRMTGGLID